MTLANALALPTSRPSRPLNGFERVTNGPPVGPLHGLVPSQSLPYGLTEDSPQDGWFKVVVFPRPGLTETENN